MQEEGKKLKVLCLHGYRQNEVTFREKLGSFRKLVGKRVELVFFSSPAACFRRCGGAQSRCARACC